MTKSKRPNKASARKDGKKLDKKGKGPSVIHRIGTGIKEWAAGKASVFKFAAIFSGLVIAFYLLYVSPFYSNHLLPAVYKTQAHIANWFLNLFGFKTSVSGIIISGEGFSVSLQRGCDGLESIAILLAGMAIIPVPIRLKIPGFLAGATILLVLNQIRIGGLYLVGLYWPKAFDFFHLNGGFIIFSLAAILIILVWARWAKSKMTNG